MLYRDYHFQKSEKLNAVLQLKCQINGLAHITGGSFTKLLRLKNTGFDLDA